MSVVTVSGKALRRFAPILLFAGGLCAQTCLVLSPLRIQLDGTATMELALHSAGGEAPAAVQWTLQYPASEIRSLTVDDGPKLVEAGKSSFCAEDAAGYRCLAVGANRNAISAGVIARFTVVLAPGVTTTKISVKNPMGASASGALIPISSMTMPTPRAIVSPTCRLRLSARSLVYQ
jgi:hypothetical protein